MTIEEKKEFMKGYKRAVAKIKALDEELQAIEYDRLPGGIDYSRDKVQTSPSSDQMINQVIRIEEVVERIIIAKEKAIKICSDILKTIDTTDNDTYQTILHRRYILLQSWEEIAVAMNYSLQWVYLTHGEALSDIKIIKD